jgi:hypothetical protein
LRKIDRLGRLSGKFHGCRDYVFSAGTIQDSGWTFKEKGVDAVGVVVKLS